MAVLTSAATSVPPMWRSRMRLRARKILIVGGPLLVGLILVSPLVMLIANSFNVASTGKPMALGLGNWVQAFSDASTLSALGNSFSLAVVRTVISLPVGLLITWLIARTDMPGRSLIEVLSWLSIFTPILPLTLGWVLLLEPRFGLINTLLESLFGLHDAPFNIYSFWGITWVYLASNAIAYKVVLLTPAFRRVNSSMEEAARVCGAGGLRTVFRITFPLLAPAILLVTAISLIFSFEGFEVELLLGEPVHLYVYSTRVYDLVSNQPSNVGEATALAFIFLVWLLLLTTAYRLLLRGRSYVTVTGREFSTAPVRLHRWRWVAMAVCLLFYAVALLLPFTFLVLGSFMRLFGFFTVANAFTTQHWLELFHDPAFLSSVRNSLIISSVAAVVAIVLYSLVAYAIIRHRSKLLRFSDILVWAPWAMPGILISLGLLWLFLATPARTILYGSLLGIITAFVFRQSPLSTQLFKSSLMQIGPELEEAGRTCGASWARVYFKVLLPLLAPTAVTVGLITFLSALYDISTPVLLYNSASRPLSILMLEYAFSGQTERGTAIGVLITAFVMIVLLGARKLGYSVARERV